MVTNTEFMTIASLAQIVVAASVAGEFLLISHARWQQSNQREVSLHAFKKAKYDQCLYKLSLCRNGYESY